MSIWRKRGGIIGYPNGNSYPNDGIWDLTAPYTFNHRYGEILITTPCDSMSFTIPEGITEVSIVVVGGGGGGASSTSFSNGISGGGGGGGALAYQNFTNVINSAILVSVGAGGLGGTGTSNNSTQGGTSTARVITSSGLTYVTATGGGAGAYDTSSSAILAAGGTVSAGTGGAGGGGRGGRSGQGGSGGGGAGGWSGTGGTGGYYNIVPTDGAGGGGGGGGACNGYTSKVISGGGGVVVKNGDIGLNGAAAPSNNTGNQTNIHGRLGSNLESFLLSRNFGGGGTGAEDDSGGGGANGGDGVVRIIWGAGRAFPSTNAGQEFSYGNITEF